MAHHKITVDPGKPHAFVRANDPGMAAVASGSFALSNTDVRAVAVTNAYQRDDARCAVPGCGRPRDDDRHATAG